MEEEAEKLKRLTEGGSSEGETFGRETFGKGKGKGKAKPRNPRDFEAIGGGRKRGSDTFTHKNSGSCIKRSTTTVSCTILASKHCLRRLFLRL